MPSAFYFHFTSGVFPAVNTQASVDKPGNAAAGFAKIASIVTFTVPVFKLNVADEFVACEILFVEYTSSIVVLAEV